MDILKKVNEIECLIKEVLNEIKQIKHNLAEQENKGMKDFASEVIVELEYISERKWKFDGVSFYTEVQTFDKDLPEIVIEQVGNVESESCKWECRVEEHPFIGYIAAIGEHPADAYEKLIVELEATVNMINPKNLNIDKI